MNSKRRLGLALAGSCAVLSLTGCPWWGGPKPVTNAPPAPPAPASPPPPATTAPNSNVQVFVSGTAIVNGVLSVHVTGLGSSALLSGANVSLEGPTLAWGISNANQDLSFQPLQAGTYSVRVSAPGYATQILGPVTVAPQASNVPIPNPPLSTRQSVTLVPQNGRVLGHVRDATGNPVAGAWVVSGDNAAFTASDGSYALMGLGAGTNRLSIGKTGYQGASVTASLGGSDASVPDVQLATQSVIVSFENARQSFQGTTIASALQPLRDLLITNQFTVSDGASNASIRVVASPTASTLDPATVSRLQTFVTNGGKLVLFGDWGGSLDYTPEALNQLASAFGLSFNPDLVRSSQNLNGVLGWVRVPGLSGLLPSPSAMPNGITLFEACSLFVPPPAQGIAYAGSAGYRIADLGNNGPCVAAIRAFGAGIVMCVGDTSAWTQGSISGNSGITSNLGEANNREFMLNLFRW